MTVLGTRPEIIRLSAIIELLDRYCDHVVVHTGQNYDARLSEVFFKELGIRTPNVHMRVRGNTFGEQVGALLTGIEVVFDEHKPDRLLVLGDTNSALVSVVAARRNIAVYHMEAGNRSYDDRVPEEVNRRLIDHASTVLLPYTTNSKENLLAEGIPSQRIYVTGNPIYQVMQRYLDKIEASTVLGDLKVSSLQYFLVTLHRAENVDIEERLRAFLEVFMSLSKKYDLPVVCSLHPRTRSKLEQWGLRAAGGTMILAEPFGFPDFVHLERSAFCVLSDSGTVQEECAVLGVPNITLRDVTERPETLEAGSNALGGADLNKILSLVSFVTKESRSWVPPPEYVMPYVAETVSRILLSYRLPHVHPSHVVETQT